MEETGDDGCHRHHIIVGSVGGGTAAVDGGGSTAAAAKGEGYRRGVNENDGGHLIWMELATTASYY